MFDNLLNQSFSSKRLTQETGGNRWNKVAVLSNQPCQIQQTGDLIDLGGGKMGKYYKMWCYIVDLIESDEITDDSGNVYIVKSIDDMPYKNNPHLVVILSEQI